VGKVSTNDKILIENARKREQIGLKKFMWSRTGFPTLLRGTEGRMSAGVINAYYTHIAASRLTYAQ